MALFHEMLMFGVEFSVRTHITSSWASVLEGEHTEDETLTFAQRLPPKLDEG
jgi:hypothetical protein